MIICFGKTQFDKDGRLFFDSSNFLIRFEDRVVIEDVSTFQNDFVLVVNYLACDSCKSCELNNCVLQENAAWTFLN